MTLLTERQEDVLYLTMSGYSIQEIADTLGIPHRTAKYASDRLRTIFGVSRRRHLIKAGNKALDAASRSAIRSRIRQQKEEKVNDHALIIDRPHPSGLGGTQKVYRFPNGYGASVIDVGMAYTRDWTFELGVLKYDGPGPDDYHLTYDTPITDDVLGYQTAEEIAETLDRIAALPPKEEK